MDGRDRDFTRIVFSGLWLYGAKVVNNVFGSLFWITISWIASPAIVGRTSAVLGLGMIMGGLLGLGTNISIRRFIGKAVGLGDRVLLKKYYWSTIYFIALLSLVVLLIIYSLSMYMGGFLAYSHEMISYACIIAFLSIYFTVISIFIGLLRTKYYFLSNLIANTVKLSMGIYLVYLGLGWIGAYIGYALQYLVLLILGLAYTCYHIGVYLGIDWSKVKEVIYAGIATWIPSIIALLGQWLGVVFLYGLSNEISTGQYYIAFLIASFVTTIGTSILNIMLPALSSMESGHEEIVRRILGFTYAILSPITAYLIFNSNILLLILGTRYNEVPYILPILLFSAYPQLLFTASISILYAFDKYREVLYLGLIQNIPRIILYLLLTPTMAGAGAAISYTIGSYTALAYSLYLSRKYRYIPNPYNTLLPIIASLTIFYIVRTIYPNTIVQTILLALVYMLFIHTNIIGKNDLRLLLHRIKR